MILYRKKTSCDKSSDKMLLKYRQKKSEREDSGDTDRSEWEKLMNWCKVPTGPVESRVATTTC